MKPKYHGIFTVLATLVVFGLAGGFYGVGFRPLPGRPEAGPAFPAQKTPLPSPAQLAEVARLSKRLSILAKPGAVAETGMTLKLFGQAAEGRSAAEQARLTEDDSREADHRLSVTLLTGSRRFCIVDGDFLAQGARLPDGFHVARIERNKIELVRGKVRQWLLLEENVPGSISSVPKDQKGSS